MNDLVLPAPLWRRLIAAVYDGLLMVGLVFATVIFFLIGCWALGVQPNSRILGICLFGVGLGFFGWFWTHGGQTLGMRVWQLRVRRLDGRALRWPIAAVRYTVMFVVWLGLPVSMLLLFVPRFENAHPGLTNPSIALLSVLVCSLLLSRLDARRRAPHDWISGTEVVVEPKAA
ncbi:RDD family protein [Solimonas fluminis]|uniref:RDD family protein n=1 Tax=Solimonas fluminis TaxID=2086571 RepID=UPI0013FE0F7D|nr:RDD family protein [Solimonas fluminis]